MDVLFSDKFRHDYNSIKDSATRQRIHKAIVKLGIMPECGKPLTHDMKGCRRLVIAPFRLIYQIEGGNVLIVCFEHRKSVYK